MKNQIFSVLKIFVLLCFSSSLFGKVVHFEYITLSKEVNKNPQKYAYRMRYLLSYKPDFIIVNSIMSYKARRMLFPSRGKICGMRKKYDVCLLKTSGSINEKQKVKIVSLPKIKGMAVPPIGFLINNKLGVIVVSVAKKEIKDKNKKRLYSERISNLEKTVTYMSQKENIPKESIFIVGDFGLSYKDLLEQTPFAPYLKDGNRVENMGRSNQWVSNVLGYVGTEQVQCKVLYDFPKKIYKTSTGSVFAMYEHGPKFLPVMISLEEN